MDIKIRRVTVGTLQLPLVVPFRVAYGATLVAEPCVVQLLDEEGNVGLGEGAPASSSTQELRRVARALTKELAELCHALCPNEAQRKLERRYLSTIHEFPTAYAAVEMALYDLMAKQRGVPLSGLVGSANLSGCKTDITLPLMNADEIESFWRRYEGYEFPIVKVKVKGIVADDLRHVRTLHQLLPKSTQILLDGNQGYNREGALKLLDMLSREGVRKPLFFEQPLPKNDWNELRLLTSQSPIPICLDETIVTSSDATRAVAERTGSMINLKLMKSGVAETLKIIEIARKANLPLMIGGMVETEIAMTASLHVLCGTNAIQYADLDTPFFIRDRITEESPWHRNSADLICPKTPGIGLNLSPGLEWQHQTIKE